MSLRAVPGPMSDAFAVTDAEREGSQVSAATWKKCGAWKHREFGNEVQLRNSALPHLALDLYRAEAEDLYAALAELLCEVAPLPFRLSRWQRFSQWWMRAVWKRKHYAEMRAANEAIVEHFTRNGPWGS